MTWFPRSRSLIFGATLPWRALKAIVRNPDLLLLSAFPVLITGALYVYVLERVNVWAKFALVAYLSSLGFEAGSAWITVALLTIRVILFLLSALTFGIAASVVASPFNDWLAERAERHADPPLPPSTFEGSRGIRGTARVAMIDLAKGVAAAGAGLVALLISWLPLLNLVAFAIAFLLVAFQYLSYPQTRRGVGLASDLSFLLRYRFACVGFGATMTLLFAIPLVGSLAAPLAVVGGTFLVARAARGEPGLR